MGGAAPILPSLGLAISAAASHLSLTTQGRREVIPRLYLAPLFCFSGAAFMPTRRGLSIYFRNQHFSLIYDSFQEPEACLTSPLSLKLAHRCKNILEEPQGWKLLKLL